MRLYFEIARRGYRQYAAYRGATIGGLFTNTMFGFMRAYILLAVYEGTTNVGGFDATDTVTYVWMGQGILAAMFVWGWFPIAQRVQTGEIATDLYRPVDLQAYWLAHDLGRALYHTLFRGVVPFAIGGLVFHLAVPLEPGPWIAFAASLVLGVCVSFAFRFLMNLTAFWLLDWRGVAVLSAVLMNLMSGFIIPITFFPEPLEVVARALPFAAMIQLPIEVFLGKHTGAGLAGILVFQAAWFAALILAGRIVLARATRKLVVQGG